MSAVPNDGAFSEDALFEKLARLNNSQQSIETLSHWCQLHRKRARQVVHVWNKDYQRAPKDRKVALLYLANDILQNSRRKGPEFHKEWYDLLPPALSDALRSGDPSLMKTATRLIEIWDERKVFGSKSQSLREEVFGSASPPPASPSPKPAVTSKELNEKSLAGGPFAPLAAAMQAVQEAAGEEKSALLACNRAMGTLQNLSKDPEGHQAPAILANKIREKRLELGSNLVQLDACEKRHAMLAKLLRETLAAEEASLSMIRSELQEGVGRIEQALAIEQQLKAAQTTSKSTPSTISQATPSPPLDPRQSTNRHNPHAGSASPPSPVAPWSQQPSTPGEAKGEEPDNAVAAAEMAARLAASASSAALLASVFSSLSGGAAVGSGGENKVEEAEAPSPDEDLEPPSKRAKVLGDHSLEAGPHGGQAEGGGVGSGVTSEPWEMVVPDLAQTASHLTSVSSHAEFKPSSNDDLRSGTLLHP